MALPEPTPEAREHSERVAEHIRGEITASGGWISFARYMELALYAPGLGYYSAGAKKLGKAGDFVTAPEISPLYGQTLARQVKQVLDAGFDEVLEVGAGSGALAATLLEELDREDPHGDECLSLVLLHQLVNRFAVLDRALGLEAGEHRDPPPDHPGP